MLASSGQRRVREASDTAWATLEKVRAGVKTKKHIWASTWQPGPSSTPCGEWKQWQLGLEGQTSGRMAEVGPGKVGIDEPRQQPVHDYLACHGRSDSTEQADDNGGSGR